MILLFLAGDARVAYGDAGGEIHTGHSDHTGQALSIIDFNRNRHRYSLLACYTHCIAPYPGMTIVNRPKIIPDKVKGQ